ncbi:hypothetical protein EMIHUDRAFT_449019 [Emiliania huxleyi CCMP1516]|uniref:glucan 1,3-beta-glucosidase n=2 Tax=Emiliania huxleyi TaxID=2903 RepID=A0A0D3KQX9_EMIH1|nr:hypothetical protein EMIHUDRAFT_449019 [Emiliania huxleyi CCMP1516]EOD38164.1 hypothetical protein EMIHUDRAFT_449019 [Emiliania huxleyi CCMP1516]|eukprot:XP_005790593.1 hypothetical protein EMIHUDRAFT_449019 [Emiliania huxleyi CCMP1516]
MSLRARSHVGFVSVSWRLPALSAAGGHRGWFVGTLAATGHRSGLASALAVEVVPPPPSEAAEPTGGARGGGCARTRRLGYVRMRAPGRRGVGGTDDWMGGGRHVAVDSRSGALRLSGYTGSAELESKPAVFAVEEDFTTVASRASLCELPRGSNASFWQRMEAHIDGWIGEEHFDWMVGKGINAVRLPLGWWDARGVVVLLDLHGAPGGQNGKEHSGCAGRAEWHRYSIDNSLAVARLLDAGADAALRSHHGTPSSPCDPLQLRRLMDEVGEHPALWGVELLNEPGDLSSAPREDEMRPLLIEYYEAAYSLVRRRRADVAVVFCVLYWFDLWGWVTQLREPQFHNVFIDLHLYTAFDGLSEATPDETVVQAARTFGCRLLQHARHHPVVVGEWSLAVDEMGLKVSQRFVDTLFASFAAAFGHFFWTLQMDAAADMAEHDHLGGHVKIGQSPQWSLVQALDAVPNRLPDGSASSSSASLASLRSLRSVATHRGPVKSPSIASFHYSIASSADRRKANHGSSASLASLGSVATHRSVASPSLVSIHAYVHSTSPNHRERGGKEKYVRLLSD